MKTVLIYVLSAHIPPWDRMISNAKHTWDDEYWPGTHTIYYSGRPMRPPEDRVWQFPIDEHYSTMGAKNLLAYEEALKLPWDYMARVHSSCYVHKRRLLDHCQTLPDTDLVRGIVLDPSSVCGVTRQWLWGGAHMILSRDVIERIVANKTKWRHDLMEDVATSEIAHDLGIPLDGNGLSASLNLNTDGSWLLITYGGTSQSMELTNESFAKINEARDQFFIRCKHDPDRRVDHIAMKLLKKHLND